jgi:hypothetical protein
MYILSIGVVLCAIPLPPCGTEDPDPTLLFNNSLPVLLRSPAEPFRFPEAAKQWSWAYLAKKLGYILVQRSKRGSFPFYVEKQPLEGVAASTMVGKSTQRTNMQGRDFVRKLLQSVYWERNSTQYGSLYTSGPLATANDGVGKILRPLGKELLPQLVSLSAAAPLKQLMANIWVSSLSAQTPLHYDERHNLFVQIKGRKRIWLFSPKLHLNLSYYPALSPGYRQSQLAHDPRGPPDMGNVHGGDVDVEMCNSWHNSSVRPLLARVQHLATYVVDVDESDVLYIPPYWGHHIETTSVTPSISISGAQHHHHRHPVIESRFLLLVYAPAHSLHTLFIVWCDSIEHAALKQVEMVTFPERAWWTGSDRLTAVLYLLQLLERKLLRLRGVGDGDSKQGQVQPGRKMPRAQISFTMLNHALRSRYQVYGDSSGDSEGPDAGVCGSGQQRQSLQRIFMDQSAQDKAPNKTTLRKAIRSHFRSYLAEIVPLFDQMSEAVQAINLAHYAERVVGWSMRRDGQPGSDIVSVVQHCIVAKGEPY